MSFAKSGYRILSRILFGNLKKKFMKKYEYATLTDYVMNNQHNIVLPGWEDFVDNKFGLTELKKGLDAESIRLMRLFISRKLSAFSFLKKEKKMFKKIIRVNLSKYKIKNFEGFQPAVFYYKNGLSFLNEEVVKKTLANRCIIDGGACSGDSAIMFSQYKEVDSIYSFEPIKKICNDMAVTLELNKCERAHAVQKALSDGCSTVDICGEQCETITVDEFCKDKKIGCIKFDLEGMETSALKGSLETIKRDKPILLICLYHTELDFYGIKPMLEALNLGYKFMIRDTEPCNPGAGVHLMLIGYVE